MDGVQFRSAAGGNVVLTVWLSMLVFLLYLPLVVLAAIYSGAWIWAGAGTLPVVIAFLAWYPKRWVAGIRIHIDHQAIRLESGVFWRKEAVIPLPSLRTIETMNTPLMRRFGCANLLLRFTGGMSVLPFVTPENIHHIRQFWESI